MFVLASHFPVLVFEPTLLEVKGILLKHPGRGASRQQTKDDYTRWRYFGQIHFVLSVTSIIICDFNEFLPNKASMAVNL